MSSRKIDIYHASSGVVATFAFPEEKQYVRAVAFLDGLVGGPAGKPEPGVAAFYYLETKEQSRVFYEFLRQLKRDE